MKNNQKSEKEQLEDIKNTKKPDIVILVPGFSDMNSGPMSVGNDIFEEDADD